MEDLIKKCPKDWEHQEGNFAGFRIHFRPTKQVWVCGYESHGKGKYSSVGKTPREALEVFVNTVLPKLRGLK